MRAGSSRASAWRSTPERRPDALVPRAESPALDAMAPATRPRLALDVHVDARALDWALAEDVRHGLVGDFERHLSRVPPPEGRRLVLFLGSTIGNLDPPARSALLRQVRALLREGDRLLLGVDLVKDTRVLEAAYDDAAGVTREFN